MRSLFEVPPSLQSDHPDPRRFAADLTRAWLGREAAQAREPVVAKVIRAGLKHPVTAGLDEQVSESVYVMF